MCTTNRYTVFSDLQHKCKWKEKKNLVWRVEGALALSQLLPIRPPATVNYSVTSVHRIIEEWRLAALTRWIGNRFGRKRFLLSSYHIAYSHASRRDGTKITFVLYAFLTASRLQMNDAKARRGTRNRVVIPTEWVDVVHVSSSSGTRTVRKSLEIVILFVGAVLENFKSEKSPVR